MVWATTTRCACAGRWAVAAGARSAAAAVPGNRSRLRAVTPIGHPLFEDRSRPSEHSEAESQLASGLEAMSRQILDSRQLYPDSDAAAAEPLFLAGGGQ